MPELPEVETVVRDLRPLLVGRRLVTLRAGDKSLRRPWVPEWGPALLGHEVRVVRRRGKWIIVALDGDLHLVFHLGMTGQLTVVPAGAPENSHTHLAFGLASSAKTKKPRSELRFRDMRRFGSATLFTSFTTLEAFFEQSGLGPEPFAVYPGYWYNRLFLTRRSLKAVLLDQSVVAGVGNIYADEALFQARLHPARRGESLTTAEADRLRRAVATVLARAIERRGSTIRDYVGGSGLRGGYQDEFRVYGRTGEPCPRCGAAVVRTRLAGRSTHYCPNCQPPGGRKKNSPRRTRRAQRKKEN